MMKRITLEDARKMDNHKLLYTLVDRAKTDGEEHLDVESDETDVLFAEVARRLQSYSQLDG
jgi:hypothetical protein